MINEDEEYVYPFHYEINEYQKLPCIIKAIRWSGKYDIESLRESGKCDGDYSKILELQTNSKMIKEIYISHANSFPNGQSSIVIETLEGTMVANPGDWIIKGINGELYPCKHDIFIKSYELAGDQPEDEE